MEIDKILSPGINYRFKIVDSRGEVYSPTEFQRFAITRGDTDNTITFKLSFDFKTGPETEVLLHTDLVSEKWTYLSFIKIKSANTETAEDHSQYLLDIKLPPGGYFSFRYLIILPEDTVPVRYWEPSGYHRMLIDPPLAENLRMYTLIPPVSGKISDWTAELDRIHHMGFNTIHLLPVTSMGPSESPYSASDYFTIDSRYIENNDGFDEFARFVSKAETLGLSLCFDIVLNHVSDSSIIAREHGNWLIPDQDRPDGYRRAGCWHQGTWISWEDLVLINYDHPDPQTRTEIYEYMLEYVLFWVKKAEKCGSVVRLDNFHSSNPDFLKWLLKHLREKAPSVPVLGEFFGSRRQLSEGIIYFGLNILTGNSWESPFVPQLQDYLIHLHEPDNPARYFLSPTSHDTETASELFGTPLSSIPRYLCCTLMGTGQAGIVQGFEYGLKKKIDFIGRQDRIFFNGDTDFTDIIAGINNLLEEEDTFRKKGIKFLETGDDSILVAVRKDEETGKTFLIGANFNTVEDKHFICPPEFNKTPVLSFRTSVNDNGNGHPVINFHSCGITVLRKK